MKTKANLQCGIIRYSRNKEGRDFVCGDIHGRFSQLHKALVKIGFNYGRDRLFGTGDLVDKGDESIDALTWLNKGWLTNSVLGNHDEHVTHYKTVNVSKWLECGGVWHTYLSDKEKEAFAQRFSSLPLILEIETKSGLVGIIHGDCPTDDWAQLVPMLHGRERTQKERKRAISICLHSRERFNEPVMRAIKNIKAVYFGHCPVAKVTQRENCYYIDTFDQSGQFSIIELK